MEFAFDDDVFETKSKSANRTVEEEMYNVKIETPGFFMNSSEFETQDPLDCFRMKANYHFMKCNYEEALSLYEKCYEIALSGGAKFEYLESQVHCCLKLQRFGEAKRLGIFLYQSAANFDQQIQAVFALKNVYEAFSSIDDCIVILGVLLHYFDSNPHFWLSFGRWLAKSSTMCDNCRSTCEFCSFVRCAELTKVLQIDGERKHLIACSTKCENLLNTFEGRDYESVKKEMCKDIMFIKNVDDKGGDSSKFDGKKIEESFEVISTKFMKKWFSFVTNKCSMCVNDVFSQK